MPGYNKKQLQKYKHDMPKCPQNCPYQPQEKKYGKAGQDPIPEDTSSGLEEKEIIAIIAYLQRLGTDIKKLEKTEESPSVK